MARQQVDWDEYPEEFRGQMDEMMERYENSGEDLQTFLNEESEKLKEEEDRKRREEEEQQRQSNEAIKDMVFSGSNYVKDLANQVGQDPREDAVKAQELRQNLSKEGQPSYHYKGDKDAGTPDMDVTKKDNNFFQSSNNPNDFNFSRSSPQGLNGKQFEVTALTQNDKQKTVDQINRIEDKTFQDAAKENPQLNYEKKQTDDNKIEHKFTQKENGQDMTQEQELNVKKSFLSNVDKNAKADATQNKEEAPEVKTQRSNLPTPKYTSGHKAEDDVKESKDAEKGNEMSAKEVIKNQVPGRVALEATKKLTEKTEQSSEQPSNTDDSKSNIPTLKPK